MIDYQLTGKTAIVTGGVSGIGLAVAQTLAASGARISVWDLKQDAVDATVAQLRDAGAQAIGIALDVTDDAAVEAAVQRTIKELDGLHVAVNNAGIGGPAASSGDYPIDGWQRVIDVNLTSVFLCQRAQIRAMRAAGSGGSIINMASILGQVGYAGSTAYAAAKHGVVGLTQTAAWEHAADGIRVNAVGPGFISTPLLEKMAQLPPPAIVPDYLTMVALGAISAFTLPHQFHVGVVELRQTSDLKTARWLFPVYLLLIGLLFVGYGCLGLTLPGVSVLAMDRHGAIAGTAAALMGSLHFAVGALAMLLVGWLGSGQPLAMLLGIAGCALASWALGLAVLTGQRQAALTDV